MRIKKWTENDVKQLRELCLKHTQKEAAAIMGLTIGQVGSAVLRYGIKSRSSGRFEKGMRPHNFGKKVATSDKCYKTTFKKGNLPHNTKYDGCISIRKDNSNKSYKFIRIDKGKWVLLHRHNWEKVFGPIPDGYLVVFRNGDTMNCDPGNLEIITRAENAMRNVNRTKSAESIKKLYKRERIRKLYGLPPVSRLKVSNY